MRFIHYLLRFFRRQPELTGLDRYTPDEVEAIRVCVGNRVFMSALTKMVQIQRIVVMDSMRAAIGVKDWNQASELHGRISAMEDIPFILEELANRKGTPTAG